MSERNKMIARRFYDEVMSAGRIEAVDELCTPDFIEHTAMPGQAPGRDGVKAVFADFSRAFPDMRVTIHEIVAERDIVAVRFTSEATHKGELFGTPATGKRITFNGIDMIRFRDGKAAEAWHYGDDVQALASIGIRLPE